MLGLSCAKLRFIILQATTMLVVLYLVSLSTVVLVFSSYTWLVSTRLQSLPSPEVSPKQMSLLTGWSPGDGRDPLIQATVWPAHDKPVSLYTFSGGIVGMVAKRLSGNMNLYHLLPRWSHPWDLASPSPSLYLICLFDSVRNS